MALENLAKSRLREHVGSDLSLSSLNVNFLFIRTNSTLLFGILNKLLHNLWFLVGEHRIKFLSELIIHRFE